MHSTMDVIFEPVHNVNIQRHTHQPFKSGMNPSHMPLVVMTTEGGTSCERASEVQEPEVTCSVSNAVK